MKRTLLFTLVLICPTLFTKGSIGVGQKLIEGHWTGTLDANGVKLRLVFHASKIANGTWIETMDSPDQGARGIPSNVSSFTPENVRFDGERNKGKFSGKMSADGKKINGQWVPVPATSPLTLERASAGRMLSQSR